MKAAVVAFVAAALFLAGAVRGTIHTDSAPPAPHMINLSHLAPRDAQAIPAAVAAHAAVAQKVESAPVASYLPGRP